MKTGININNLKKLGEKQEFIKIKVYSMLHELNDKMETINLENFDFEHTVDNVDDFEIIKFVYLDNKFGFCCYERIGLSWKQKHLLKIITEKTARNFIKQLPEIIELFNSSIKDRLVQFEELEKIVGSDFNLNHFIHS